MRGNPCGPPSVLLAVLGWLVAEGFDRLDFERFQVNEEDPSTAAARVAAAVSVRIVKLGYA